MRDRKFSWLYRWRWMVTGQLADKPTRGQSSRGLVNSRTSQLAGMFDLKFGVYNSSDYTIYTLPIFDRVRVRVRIRFNVQIKYSNSMIFKNSLSASWPVCKLSSPRLDWTRVGLSANCPVGCWMNAPSAPRCTDTSDSTHFGIGAEMFTVKTRDTSALVPMFLRDTLAPLGQFGTSNTSYTEVSREQYCSLYLLWKSF